MSGTAVLNNTGKIKRVLYDRVWIEPEAGPEKVGKESILYMPDTAKDAESSRVGRVMAVGPGMLDSNGKWHECTVAEGDRVLFMSYKGQHTKVDGVDYIVVSEKDVLAVLDEVQ